MSRRAVQPIERLMAKVVVDEATGCWLWQGHLTDGYGRFYTGGPMVTTSFCVYPTGHRGRCSWADTPSVRLRRLRGEFAAASVPAEKEDAA